MDRLSARVVPALLTIFACCTAGGAAAEEIVVSNYAGCAIHE